MSDAVLLGLLHLLVFAYWLGGDLGAFYASRFLILPGVPAERRLLALKIVNDVDMAARTSLILTLPTGLALAQSKAWLDPGWPVVVAVAAVSAVWLAFAWHIHNAHGQAPEALRRADLAIRWALLLGLSGWVIAGLAELTPLPLFLALKLLILAGCIALGLIIRRVLRPLGAAIAGLAGPDRAAAETSLAKTLGRARALVACIWALLIAAALTGLWTPL